MTLALLSLRWGLVTRSMSEKRKRYTSSWEAMRRRKRQGQLEQGKRVGHGSGPVLCACMGAQVHRGQVHNCGVLELEGVSLWSRFSLYRPGTWLTQGHTNNQSFTMPCPPPNTHRHRHRYTNTSLCPFPAFLTLIQSPGIPPFSAISVPPSLSFPIAPHLPFSPLLHSHGSLQQQLPDVLRSNPQHGGRQVQGAERTQVLRDMGWGGSWGWAGLPPPPSHGGSLFCHWHLPFSSLPSWREKKH